MITPRGRTDPSIADGPTERPIAGGPTAHPDPTALKNSAT
jgi:hypothetical protein